MKKYKLRRGTKLKGIDAQVVGETIDSLKDDNGHITTEQVVESAKNEKSPIHNCFDWDDTEAAEQWRLQQARSLISVIVEVTIIENEEVEQRSFHSVHEKNESGESITVYVTLKDAVENDDYRKQLLNKAITTLENLTIMMKMFREYDK